MKKLRAEMAALEEKVSELLADIDVDGETVIAIESAPEPESSGGPFR